MTDSPLKTFDDQFAKFFGKQPPRPEDRNVVADIPKTKEDPALARGLENAHE